MTPFVLKGNRGFYPAHGITHHALVKEGCVRTAAVGASFNRDQSQNGNIGGGQKRAFRNDDYCRTAWSPEGSNVTELCCRECRTWPAVSIASGSGPSPLS